MSGQGAKTNIIPYNKILAEMDQPKKCADIAIALKMGRKQTHAYLRKLLGSGLVKRALEKEGGQSTNNLYVYTRLVKSIREGDIKRKSIDDVEVVVPVTNGIYLLSTGPTARQWQAIIDTDKLRRKERAKAGIKVFIGCPFAMV